MIVRDSAGAVFMSVCVCVCVDVHINVCRVGLRISMCARAAPAGDVRQWCAVAESANACICVCSWARLSA